MSARGGKQPGPVAGRCRRLTLSGYGRDLAQLELLPLADNRTAWSRLARAGFWVGAVRATAPGAEAFRFGVLARRGGTYGGHLRAGKDDCCPFSKI